MEALADVEEKYPEGAANPLRGGTVIITRAAMTNQLIHAVLYFTIISTIATTFHIVGQMNLISGHFILSYLLCSSLTAT